MDQEPQRERWFSSIRRPCCSVVFLDTTTDAEAAEEIFSAQQRREHGGGVAEHRGRRFGIDVSPWCRDGKDSATSHRGETECLQVEESMVDLPEVNIAALDWDFDENTTSWC